MALSNYTELQAAVRSEVNKTTSALTADALTDCIARAEAKINRRTRLREAEQLAYATYSAGNNTIEARTLALPTGFTEMLNLRIKTASAGDNTYVQAQYVTPRQIANFYTADTSGKMYYTLRDQLEFSHPVANDHEVMMHYLKKWSIATDSTNWLLTNYPDVYLYGSLAECAMHLRYDERIPLWKSYFDDGIRELNEMDSRSRDDAVLDTSEVASMAQRSSYNILTGGY